MSRLGSADVNIGELLSIDALLARIDAVTLDDVAREAAAVLEAPRALTVIGPFEPDRTFALD